MPRILIAGLFHETHTFLDGVTPLSDFQIRRGDDMLACKGDSSPLGGVLEIAEVLGWEMIPTADYRAQPSATVADEVVEAFWNDIAPAIVKRDYDAIFLVLHGAMSSQSYPSVEDQLFGWRLREILPWKSIPIFGVLDLHANLGGIFKAAVNCLVAYRENPHTDARDAAVRAASLLQRSLTTGVRPQMHLRKPGIIWPPTGTGTATDPMRSLETLARELEQTQRDIWDVSILAGFSFADTPHCGVGLAITTTCDDGRIVQNWLNQLEQKACSLRHLGEVTDPPVDDVLASLRPLPAGLTVLVEPSDNIGGGAPGDGTGLLRALIRHNISNAAVCINDPQSVREIESGARHIALGGKGSRLDAGPLELDVELIALNDGRFELEDKNSHLASMCGDVFNMGRCAIVKHAAITILITSIKTPPFDLGQWRSQGIEPTQFSVIGVKAAVAHRRAYDGIAALMLWVDTPGPCSSNLKSLPYRNLRMG